MKIKLSDPVTGYDGKPILISEKGNALTFFDVFVNAINSTIQGEPPMTAEVKNEIYQLSKKLYSSKEPIFTIEQLSLIKDRVGKVYAPMVYGKVVEVIEGTGAEDKATQEKAPEN